MKEKKRKKSKQPLRYYHSQDERKDKMSDLTCQYTYVRGQHRGQKCGRPAKVSGLFCAPCATKRGPADTLKKMNSKPNSEKIGDPILAKPPTLRSKSLQNSESEKEDLGQVLINPPPLGYKYIGNGFYESESESDSDSDSEKETFINFDVDAPGVITGAILDQVRKEENTSKNKPRIWFDGEFDSNQTKFEKMSNHLEIGVVAKTKRTALALLMLLRMEYDDYPSYVYYLAEDFEEHDVTEDIDPKKVPVNKLLDIIEVVRDDSYVSSFKLTDEFRVELTDGYVSKRLHEVDVWTVTRFENE